MTEAQGQLQKSAVRVPRGFPLLLSLAQGFRLSPFLVCLHFPRATLLVSISFCLFESHAP